MNLEFTAEVLYWRGPAPHHFVPVPDEECAALHAASPSLTYGWGMIPASVEIGHTTWTTSLFPKDGGYLVPIKGAVRAAEELEVGDMVTVRLIVGV